MLDYVRAMCDGQLWLAHETCATETAWAPRHTAAARKAGDHDRTARHETLAASYRPYATTTSSENTISRSLGHGHGRGGLAQRRQCGAPGDDLV